MHDLNIHKKSCGAGHRSGDVNSLCPLELLSRCECKASLTTRTVIGRNRLPEKVAPLNPAVGKGQHSPGNANASLYPSDTLIPHNEAEAGFCIRVEH